MDTVMLPDIAKLALYVFIIFYSNIVQALTGFAGVMLSIPPIILLYGPDTAKAVINIICWLICVIIAWQNRRFIDLKQVRHIVSYMLVGMAVGIVLYRHTDAGFLIPFYGAVIVLVALKNLLMKPSAKELSDWIYNLILFGAGIIHGMFVSGGALLVIYLAAKFKDKNSFRANVAAVWCVLNLFLMFADFQKGLYTPHFFSLVALGLIPLGIALWLGNLLHEKINQQMFRRVTYGLLLMAGSLILV